eukprot:m.353284 g.353284  ORF g.353284 m.353284 type:complete len:69 (-) comp16720_c0_seq1:1809-2015(-)
MIIAVNVDQKTHKSKQTILCSDNDAGENKIQTSSTDALNKRMKPKETMIKHQWKERERNMLINTGIET